MDWKKLLLAALAPALPAMETLAGTLESHRLAAGDHPYSRERSYQVYLPDGLNGPAPMVMALHGCRQSDDDVLHDWGLTAAADRHGFILVTPYITSYNGQRNPNCWGFWFDEHRHEGSGEPQDLLRIARAVEARHAVDPQRRYIAGLSSGGAMTVVAATTHNEYWAAAASVAGLPYGEEARAVSAARCPLSSASFLPVGRVVEAMGKELDDSYPIPLLVLQNERDCTVFRTAGRNLRDAHLALFGQAGHDTAVTALAARRPCTPVFGGDDYGCRHEIFTADGNSGSRSLVETVFYQGPLETPSSADSDRGHYWIGGERGRDGKYALRRGPSHPDIVWEFFARHPRNGQAPAGRPLVTLEGANPLHLAQGQRFADPGARARDPQDGELPVRAVCDVDSGRAGRYSCTYSASDRSGNRTSAIRTVTVAARGAPAASCAVITASPSAHVLGGRAVAGGWFLSRALATGDREDIGHAADIWSAVTLFEGAGGQWQVEPPEACGW